jgi:hypothetical protein
LTETKNSIRPARVAIVGYHFIKNLIISIFSQANIILKNAVFWDVTSCGSPVHTRDIWRKILKASFFIVIVVKTSNPTNFILLNEETDVGNSA